MRKQNAVCQACTQLYPLTDVQSSVERDAMRLIGVGILLIAPAVLFGQRGPTYGSLGGYGNVLFPGTGHAPNSAVNTFPAQLGATVAGRPHGGVPYNAPRYAHPSGHSR